jgi:TolA-binding protein
MSASDWQELIGAIGLFVLVTAVLVTSIWQFASTVRVKAVQAGENRRLGAVDNAVAMQKSTERQLADIGGRLAEMQTRLQTFERILKDEA